MLSKKAREMVSVDAASNTTYLLHGFLSIILHIEKVLYLQGQELIDLTATIILVKGLLHSDYSATSSSENSWLFSPANTLEELAALTDELQVSANTLLQL